MSLGFASRKHHAAAPQETQAASPPETRDVRGCAAGSFNMVARLVRTIGCEAGPSR